MGMLCQYDTIGCLADGTSPRGDIVDGNDVPGMMSSWDEMIQQQY